MLNKNSMLAGVLAALIFPLIAALTAYFLKNNLYLLNKPALPYFAATAANLVLIRICFKKGADKTGRAIMMATFVFMVVLFVFKIHLMR